MFSTLSAPYIYKNIRAFVSKRHYFEQTGYRPIGLNKILDVLQERDKDKEYRGQQNILKEIP